jgi:hypothetical protein
MVPPSLYWENRKFSPGIYSSPKNDILMTPPPSLPKNSFETFPMDLNFKFKETDKQVEKQVKENNV